MKRNGPRLSVAGNSKRQHSTTKRTISDDVSSESERKKRRLYCLLLYEQKDQKRNDKHAAKHSRPSANTDFRTHDTTPSSPHIARQNTRQTMQPELVKHSHRVPLPETNALSPSREKELAGTSRFQHRTSPRGGAVPLVKTSSNAGERAIQSVTSTSQRNDNSAPMPHNDTNSSSEISKTNNDVQTMMTRVVEMLQSQGPHSEWKGEVPVKTRAQNIYRMIISLRFIQPRIDLTQAAQASMSFELNAFTKADTKIEYDEECNKKLWHIRNTHERQKKVTGQVDYTPAAGAESHTLPEASSLHPRPRGRRFASILVRETE